MLAVSIVRQLVYGGCRRVLPVSLWMWWSILSIGLAQANPIHMGTQFSDIPAVGIYTYRQDSGTALDILTQIEFHQTPAAALGQFAPHEDTEEGLDELLQVGHELDALLDYPGEQHFIFY